MSNFKCFEMEDIAYKEWMEWSDHLDLVANSRANSWLPAYGYHTSQPQELLGQNDSYASDVSLGQQQCLFLETIIEETSDDLCSESDKSGPTGWNSDSDADSVIHLPKLQGALPEIRTEWRTADLEAEPPKKQKRRFHDRLTLSDDEETQDIGESASLSSRSSSLIAFESLEKHCEDVFKTTASSDPFGQEIHSDPVKWKWFPSGSLEDTRGGFSSDCDTSASSDDTLHRSQSSRSSFRSSLTNDSRLRSYRSFDSLNLLEDPSPIQYSLSELSQSHNALDFEKEREMRQEFIVRDKKLTATTADLSTVTDSYDTDYFLTRCMGMPFRRRPESASFHYRGVKSARRSIDAQRCEEVKPTFRCRKSYSAEGLKSQLPIVPEDSKDRTDGKHGISEPCLSAPSKSQQSVENLSEDSGYGDQISGNKNRMNINFRSSISSIPEDEDSSPLESSSSYYSDCTGSEEGSIVSTEGREHSKSLSKTGSGLKITHTKESEVRGCPTTKNDDADVKFNPSRSQTHAHNCATEAGGPATMQGKTEKLITASVTFASPDKAHPDDITRPSFETFVKDRCPDDIPLDRTEQRLNFRNELSGLDAGKHLFFEPCDEMNSKTDFEDKRQMTVRLPVASTPNLLISDEEYVFSVPSAASSLTHVPLKSLDDDCDELRNKFLSLRKSQLSGSQSTKGVHFCPIVSEVSWREVYSEDESSSEASSDPSTDEMSNRSLEEDICMQNDDEDYSEVEEKTVVELEAEANSSGSQIAEASLRTEPPETKAQDLAHVSCRPQTFGSDNKSENVNNPSNGNKACIEKKRVPPTVAGHMYTSDTASPDVEGITELSVSEVHLPEEDRVYDSFPGANCSREKMSSSKKSGKSRFGGFLERFSFRRLGSRMTSGGNSKKQKEKKEKGASNDHVASDTGEEIKIIPLHAPGEEETLRVVLTPSVVSSKPPLPPCPPRVSTASRKRPTVSGTVADDPNHVPSSNMPGVGEIDTTDVPKPAADTERAFTACEKPVLGLLETDLDTRVTVQGAVRRPLAPANVGSNKKARSLMNLGLGDMATHQEPLPCQTADYLQPTSLHRPLHGPVAVDDRAKSMEFLLDKENQAAVLPPENELQKGGTDRVMSEHQLRVQRSLQKLNIPDWYKNSAIAQTPQGFLLKRHGDSGRDHQGWPGLGSKTTSLSSLGTAQSASARSPTSHVFIPSPTPHLLSRWSTSRLNSSGTSTSTSPCGSARSSFNYRQPYLGWRSQERLTRPRTPAERLAAGFSPQQKQLVLVPHNQATPNLTEVRTSIKEVTSAIVHYVSGVQENGSREGLRNFSTPNPSPKWAPSPKGSTGRLCWLESSFVGSRPLDQPETPLTLTETPPVKTDARTTQLYLDLKPQIQSNNHLNLEPMNEHIPGVTGEQQYEKAFDLRTKPSPGSTTLDDVLDSLLGLPPTSRSPSPGPISIASANASSPIRTRQGLSLPDRQHQRHSCGDIQANVTESASGVRRVGYAVDGLQARRKSEGSNETIQVLESKSGRQSERNQNESREPTRKDLQPQLAYIEAVVKCRYSKCGKTATVLEAKRTFKTCHNCSHIYCSRECRRAHWERHRRTCLHSRVGALCRQVLATAKDDADALHQLSLLARRGYLTHGRGVVKTFFSSPELAEKFVSRGFAEMGEPAYVRWSDLLPTEMGADLYAELMKLCKSYNPDTRFVLYVAVCVVSEVPTSGAVKWERQLVSRCCKVKLDKVLAPPKSDKSPAPPPLPPRRSSSDSFDITREMENPETLILTSLPGIAGQVPEQKIREISFTNIQRELRQRGVSLRRQFPDVYKKLCVYVEGGSERFTPMTIYPRDGASGKTFMCIIMPDSEPEKLQLLPKDSARVQTIDISTVPETV